MADFDSIQYSATLYRKLLDCMACPGKVETIEPHPLGCGLRISPFAYGIAFTLVDSEVSFCVSPDDGRSARFVTGSLGGRRREIELCDLLFARGDACPDLRELKRGTLEYCDEGATAVIEVSHLTSMPTQLSKLVATLSGPGVPGTAQIWLAGLGEEVLEQRAMSNIEYPMGIDLVLVDQHGNLACLPRSTKVSWKVAH